MPRPNENKSFVGNKKPSNKKNPRCDRPHPSKYLSNGGGKNENVSGSVNDEFLQRYVPYITINATHEADNRRIPT
jgi:hypothetical protein